MRFNEKQLSQFKKSFELKASKELQKLKNHEKNIYGSIQYSFSTGGKRLRPFLIYFFGSFFHLNKKALMDMGITVELTHTYSLIHDDLPAMDDDDIRRGKPTIHKKFNEATAILCGDALQVVAFHKITKSAHISDSHKIKIIDLLCQCSGLNGLISGQSLDLNMTKSSPIIKINKMQDLKTGALFKFCFVSLGILKNFNAKQISHLEKLSFEFGKIFQITDDLLDFHGSFEKVGKKLRKDVNKPNIAYKIGYEKCLEKISIHKKNFIKYCDKLEIKNSDIINIDLLLSYIIRRDF